MFELWGVNISSDVFSMLLDGLLLLVMAALWWLWWQQARQRKHVELKLGEAAAQLQEATKMLDEALQHITCLQGDAVDPGVEPQAVVADKMENDMDDGIQRSFSGQSLAMSKVYKKNDLTSDLTSDLSQRKPVHQPIKSADQSSQSAQILRMQREGESVESIAGKMNIPLAQVKLMLMLQKSQ